jgi:cell division protein FtsA
MAKDKIVTAIDIGSSKITTLIASPLKEETLSIIGVSTVPARGIRKGQVVDIEEAIASISDSVDAAERMAGLSIGSAYISVGGAHIASQNSKGVVAVSEPEGEIRETDIARVIEAAQAVSIPSSREIIHVLPRDFVVDGQPGIKDPLGMTGIRLEVETQIVTGATTAIRNLAKCISEVGIDIAALVYSGLASSEAVLSETEKELGVILVDIGAGTTDVAIWVDGALSYSSVLPVGARNVTNDIAVGLRVSLESAEKIKLHLSEKAKPKFAFDTDENDEPEKKEAKNTDELDIAHLGLPEELKKVSRKTLVEGIIKPRLSEIFTFIGLEIQKSGFGGMTPSGVVITGGGSMTVGILEASRARLAMPCRVGSAFSQPIVKLSGLTDEINGPQFSAAAGLILHGSTTTRDFQSKKSNFRIPASLPKLPGFGKITPKLDPGKIVEKISKLLKSFLP